MANQGAWAGRLLPWAIVAVLLVSGLASAPGAIVPSSHPAPTTGHPEAGGTAILPELASPVNVSLALNATSVDLPSSFFGTTISNEVHLLRGETDSVNATPARVLVWPGAMAGEDYDPFTATHYDTYNGTPTHALTSEAQFVQMCRAIHCEAIMQVPAEIDDPSFGEAVVNYTEKNLSFTPAFWMIGNEPELWEHWKVPWKDWPYDYTNGPTPTQFGDEVVAYVDAIRHVDNTTPILGLPASGCSCSDWTFAQWIAGVLTVTGNKIQAVAFHEYPAGWLGTGDGSLLDFYATLQGAASIPVRIVAAREAVESACPGCNVSVFISELGSALSWSAYGGYADTFAGSLSIASQLTQAMDYNVSNIDLFAAELATTNSWFAPNGYARPDYGLYTDILSHLGPTAYSVNLTGSPGKSTYAIATVDAAASDREDLLVVNDNISRAISFNPVLPGGLSEEPTEVWSWNGSIHFTKANDTTWVEPFTPNPVVTLFPSGLPASYTLPQQSLVLFESYPEPASYVDLAADGVPNGTAWFADVGNQYYSTTASNLSLLLPPGSYNVSGTGIPLPLGGREHVPAEQLGAFAASPLTVAGAYQNASIEFVPQWGLNVSASPAFGGNVTPNVTWANASTPITLSAQPAEGYAFVGWSGWGPGSYNGSAPTATLLPAGRIVEKARFVLGEPTELDEIGLPTGTPWSVSVRGFTTATNASALTVYEPSGTYGFSVSPVPGYTTIPRNGSFSVTGTLGLVTIRFVPINPPGLLFAVTFHVSGLPGTTEVPITVRGATEMTGDTDSAFGLINGSYAYTLGVVPGYHAAVPAHTFFVNGRPVLVDVPFVPTVYKATIEAFGARFGMNWSVRIGGTSVPATSAWVSADLTNGSYPYTLVLPPNFTASPRTGTLVVSGLATKVYVFLNLVEFPTWFEATGPGAATPWSVRLGSLLEGADANRSSFLTPNGTYTFDIHPPAGEYAEPSHGTLTVAGSGSPLTVRFFPSSERPSAALVASLSSGALAVSVYLGAAVLVGFVGMRGLRRGRRRGR